MQAEQTTTTMTQHLLREIETIRSEGVRTYHHLADVLNSRGYTTPTGERWNGTAVAQFMIAGQS
jgi:hypothetical protein